MTKPINRQMIELARGFRGLSQSELARRAGVTQALVSKLENGLILDPTPETINSLASALHVPSVFFFVEDRIIGLPQYHYRKRSKLGKKATLKIEAETNLRRMHIDRLLRSYDMSYADDFPSIDLDRMQWSAAEAAQKIRQLWLLPRGPIENLTEVIERAGAIIIQCDFDTALIDAVSFRLPKIPPLIFMNVAMPGDRYRFTLAHELAHMILHNQPCTDEDMENQADEFASEFLLPEREVRPYLANPSLGKLARVKAYWKTSIKSLIYRSHKIKLITPSQYTGLNVNYSKAGYSRGEPFPIPVEKPTSLASAINFHMRELRYSAQEMAELLFMNIDEFRATYLPSGHSEGVRLTLVK